MNFENYMNRQMEENMHETLTMKIGDLTPDKTVNLEELCNHSTKTLQHLYRLMVENPHLELANVDDMALYFKFVKCGHEYYLPWQNVVNDVREMIEDKNIEVRCCFCNDLDADMKETAKEKRVVSSARPNNKTTNNKEKEMTIKKSDLENAHRLQFLFLEPVDKLDAVKMKRVKALASRINIRLDCYKLACKDGRLNQVKNAGKALKNGVNYMRTHFKVKCAVKLTDNQ